MLNVKIMELQPDGVMVIFEEGFVFDTMAEAFRFIEQVAELKEKGEVKRL